MIDRIARSSLVRLLISGAALLVTAFPAARAESGDGAPSIASADARRGKTLFEKYCTPCHEAHGYGDVFQIVPALAGQRSEYVVARLASFSAAGSNGPEMHRVLSRSPLTDPQTWADLARYVNQLPMMRYPEGGDGRHVAEGRQLFARQCAGCHGADALGNASGSVPALRGQNYTYLYTTLTRIAHGDRADVGEAHVTLVADVGGSGGKAIADYLSSLPRPGKHHAPTP